VKHAGEAPRDRAGMRTAAAVVLATAPPSAGFVPAWARLAGRPALAWTVDALAGHTAIDEIVVVVPEARLENAARLIADSKWRAARAVAAPRGATLPLDDLHTGLEALAPGAATVIVHEAARLLLGPQPLANMLARACEDTVVVAAAPVKETIKLVDDAGIVRRTLPRARLWQLQTPVVLPRTALDAGLREGGPARPAAGASAPLVDMLLALCTGCRRCLVPAPDDELLVRTRGDLPVVEALLRARGSPHPL
jgi:2-C-methyl-D-erythritol 4-phosphate cytidylyltransferase